MAVKGNALAAESNGNAKISADVCTLPECGEEANHFAEVGL